MKEVWLTTSYLGTVEYFGILNSADVAYIEAFENYEKQSWRNRFRILSANGPISLSIPIVKGSSPKQPVTGVRIDYRQPWQKIHFRSVESAYRHSPYYEYFIDNLRFIWDIRPEYLFEFNQLGTEAILKLMKSGVTLRWTDGYEAPGHYGPSDYRYRIHPKGKKQSTGHEPVPYHQVFADRFGFVQDLSILDWLFNDFRI
jgi:hypothetical protein